MTLTYLFGLDLLPSLVTFEASLDFGCCSDLLRVIKVDLSLFSSWINFTVCFLGLCVFLCPGDNTRKTITVTEILVYGITLFHVTSFLSSFVYIWRFCEACMLTSVLRPLPFLLSILITASSPSPNTYSQQPLSQHLQPAAPLPTRTNITYFTTYSHNLLHNLLPYLTS